MPVSDEYIEYVEDLLQEFAPLHVRRMFGGAGVYSSGLFFALIINDELYFKVHDANVQDYQRLGLKPFQYTTKAGRTSTMSYYPVPAEVQEDSGLLSAWARKALEAALHAKKG